jgi:hypothetical protein
MTDGEPETLITGIDRHFERLSIQLEFAMAREWFRVNPPLSEGQPSVGIMISKRCVEANPSACRAVI